MGWCDCDWSRSSTVGANCIRPDPSTTGANAIRPYGHYSNREHSFSIPPMLRHYYTLQHIAREMNTVLTGAMLIECFTQEKNTLIMAFERGGEELYVECSLDNKLGAVYLRPEFGRARRNSTTIFPNSVGVLVRGVRLHPEDRILTIDCGTVQIHFVLFGGASGNVLLTDTNGMILDSFKVRTVKNLALEKSVMPRTVEKSTTSTEQTVLASLTEADVFLGKIYAQEICLRSAILPGRMLGTLSDAERVTLHHETTALQQECNRAKEYLILLKGDVPLMSLLPLFGYEMESGYASVSAAIRKRIILTRRGEKFRSERSKHETNVGRIAKRLRSSIALMENDATADARAANYKQWAELLLAQPNARRLAGESITLQSWTDETLTIPLDPRLTLVENAEKYYTKTRAAAESAKVRAQRLPVYKKRLALAEEILAKLSAAATLSDIETLEQSIQTLVGKSMKDQATASKYREFPLEEGFMLYVGKSAANNDELTMKFAKQNDIWLHARGVSGSHAVIRVTGKNPPKRVIEQAAEITAYYSNARNASYTPVAYTLKKYVRKPKGANPGAVVMEREEVVMVKPRIPAGTVEEA
jgi:predicted ribosome quality control (RQC) complex YloA/Tae2 family protein